MKTNAMEQIKKLIDSKNFNVRYSLCTTDIQEIVENSNSDFELMTNLFYFGYSQGMKAEKASLRKKGGVAI